MAERKIKRALISVYDKTGIVDFARALVDEFGVEIISTGGTAALLRENSVPVTMVEQITGFPEMLDGRVKTLHPKIHAAILADRDNPEHMRQLKEQGIEPIDMVVVNLYPFGKTVADPNCTIEQAIEMIDIGGPCLLRAAAKNHKHVMVVFDPAAYKRTLKCLRGDPRVESYCWSEWLMTRAFQSTTEYDVRIHEHFARRYWETEFTPVKFLDLLVSIPTTANELRYGENAHQRGTMYSVEGSRERATACGASILSDDADPSFNNFADANAATELCKELTRNGKELGANAQLAQSHRLPTGATTESVCVFVKHTNACGVGVSADQLDAYQRAYLGDPNAAMGGILACNFEVDTEFAATVMDTHARWGKTAGVGGFFVEVWVAPKFADAAVSTIQGMKEWGKRVRLLAVGEMGESPDPDDLEYRSITGGMLVQTRDLIGLNEDQWRVVTKRGPTEPEMSDLRLAWLVAKHTKSNAISICKDGMLIGNGAGQMSRVMSCRIATWLAKENGHADKLSGAAAASDAFFPFADGPNILLEAGVTSLIQPGGSKRDEEVIKACDHRGAAMIFTGARHFKH